MIHGYDVNVFVVRLQLEMKKKIQGYLCEVAGLNSKKRLL